ncbi:hypothetical protein AAZX31_12G070100 [Glycine max]|uniref:Uncharacterized protein n=2 Tax=Glycine subgen. Soja TaxID=1462606 RepID=K7LTI4_SOYBN|nr:hypothetical protein GYH30_032981 [Glycine max]KHN05703.1 hypothetical protein glysoja_024669 [Glycine soja]KRH24964.1 hypothetical protein GLYMA_12G073400v4 [Glycine max]RZB74761.1 hypothetical protein D0Y65_033630 [Glycine soja]
MATNNSTVHNKKTSFPPKRGQIKAQIFSNLVKIVASKFSKDEKDDDDKNGGDSAISTPPPSAYSSDGV